MSLYADYKMETDGKLVIENDFGFASYCFSKGVCSIENIYIRPEYRESGKASEIADYIAQMARGKGCVKMYGSIITTAPNAHTNLEKAMGYGMKLHSAQENIVFLVKDL